jgi:hypothetical protein
VRTDGEAIHAREAPRPIVDALSTGARMRSAKSSVQSRLTDGRRSFSGRVASSRVVYESDLVVRAGVP